MTATSSKCPPNTKPVSSGCIPRSAAHVVYGERCRSARSTIAPARARTWRYQDERGAERSDRTPIAQGKTCRWARHAAREHVARMLSSFKAWRAVPVGETALRAYVNDDCLEEIIDRETAGTWSPTIYNYAGSGAYGLPQALPGHKMASAGHDWRTNPKTQVAWMRRYVVERYGGSCSALAYHNANGSY